MTKTLGVIPARMASSRFPGKPLKKILDIGKNLNGFILILDLLNLNFRKVKLKKRKFCFCK